MSVVRRVEILEELEAMMAECLALMKSRHKERMPKHIIVYHNGKHFVYKIDRS